MFPFEDLWFLDGVSIKRTLLSCTTGGHFIEIPLCHKTRWFQPKILVLIINFFRRNFTSIEIEGHRVSSNQNERTFGGGGGGGGGGVLGNEQGRTRGEGGVRTREPWANVLFDWLKYFRKRPRYSFVQVILNDIWHTAFFFLFSMFDFRISL